MEQSHDRIDKAWKASKSWISEVDGYAREAVLPKVAMEILPHAFAVLEKESENFRVSTHTSGEAEISQFVSPETIQLNIQRLLKEEISGLDINYTAKLSDYDLDMHMIVQTVARDRVDLEAIWWSDQVFPDDVDPMERFKALASYFIYLQNLFKSPKLYIGSEVFEEPGKDSDWVEV